jgi:hypothetical protein
MEIIVGPFKGVLAHSDDVASLSLVARHGAIGPSPVDTTPSPVVGTPRFFVALSSDLYRAIICL